VDSILSEEGSVSFPADFDDEDDCARTAALTKPRRHREVVGSRYCASKLMEQGVEDSVIGLKCLECIFTT
jgi:hypothetical protein